MLSLSGTERIRPAMSELLSAPDQAATEQLLRRFGADNRDFLLVGGQGQYLALAQGSDPASRERFIGRIGGLRRQAGMRLTAGIGPVATAAGTTHTAIRHALVASQWAELAAQDGGAIVRYEDVAHLRLLPSAALEMSANLKGLLAALGALVRYDLDNGTDLAQTLDTLLANSGSAARTSSGSRPSASKTGSSPA